MRIENEKRKEETKLILRVYKPADCKALTELFYETVHSVNTKDYTKEQVDAMHGQMAMWIWKNGISPF